jgi:hypothetical protein
MKKKKEPKLFGIFLGVNGSVLLIEMKRENRDAEISKILGAQKVEAFFSKKRFDGDEVACVANAYPLRSVGYRNNIASYICGGDVYGNVVILRVNDDGMKCLMIHSKARKIMEDIQNEYLFD